MDYLKKIFQFVVLCIVWSFSFGYIHAASLKFEPPSTPPTTGKNFDVKINVEVGSDQATSVDVFINYDSTMFDLGSTPITAGNFFPSTANVTNQPGKIYIAGLVTDAGTYRTGTGTLATVTFKPKNSGTSNMTFDCTQGVTASDSNIIKNDTNSSDIIVCSENNSLSVDVGGVTLTATPTPHGYTATTTPTPRSTATPTSYGYNPTVTPTLRSVTATPTPRGWVPTVTPYGYVSSYASTYDSSGSPIKVYDANGVPLAVYVSSQNPIKVYDANGNLIKVYDANGNQISVSVDEDSEVPVALPQTGTFENVMKYSLPGGIMLLVGGLLLLL